MRPELIPALFSYAPTVGDGRKPINLDGSQMSATSSSQTGEQVMRLRGWIRLGVVITFLWIVITPILMLDRKSDQNWEVAVGEEEHCIQYTPEKSCDGMKRQVFNEMEDGDKTKNLAAVFILNAFVIAAGFWIIVGLVYFSSRWIFSGFNRSDAT